MAIEWKTGKPKDPGYYLVTRAPVNYEEIALERAQDYAMDTGVAAAWYNPHNGWWSVQPGTKRSENINHTVTHWAYRPEGARPTAEQLKALPKRRWISWIDGPMEDIIREVLYCRWGEALEAVDNLKMRIIEMGE